MSLFLIFRIIQRNYTHSLKAIRGLGFTIAIIISLLSLITGLSLEASSIILQSGQSQSIIIEKDNGAPFPSNLLENLSLPNSLTILPKAESSVLLNSSGIDSYIRFIKMNLTLYLQVHPLSYLDLGRFPLNNSEIIVGDNLARTLNITIGSPLVLNQTLYQVVGIFVDDYGLLNSVLSGLNNDPEITSIEIVLENPQYGQTIITYLQSHLSSEYSITFKQRNLDFLNSIVSAFLSKFILVVLVIAILSCIRIYFFTNWIIINHLRDFLIFRIIGYSNFQILLIVFYFGMIVGNIANFYGTILAFFLTILFPSIVKSILSIHYIPFFPPVDLFIYTILLLNLFLVIGSLKPAFDVINSPTIVQKFERV